MMDVPKDKLDTIKSILPKDLNPTVSNTEDGGFDVFIVTEKKLARDLMPELKKVGATCIIEFNLTKII